MIEVFIFDRRPHLSRRSPQCSRSPNSVRRCPAAYVIAQSFQPFREGTQRVTSAYERGDRNPGEMAGNKFGQPLDFTMSEPTNIAAECLTPILYVRDFNEAMAYYTEKLLFERLWDWGDPPDFGAVRLGKVEIFFCQGGQGSPGTWLSIFLEDVDSYYERIKQLGAEVIQEPRNMPWGIREIHVRDPNQHVLRFGHGIPSREPKLAIERVKIEARIEKRLFALLEDLAKHKGMSLGEMLEETFLHTFEQVPAGGVASPHTLATLKHIQELKAKHGIDYETHASYRFVEPAGSPV
jgi:predicted enzyme related to lactoylglutathione lyase